MDRRSLRYFIFAALISLLTISVHISKSQGLCEETLKRVIQRPFYIFYHVWTAEVTEYLGNFYWVNMTLWDGYMQLSVKDNVDPECFTSRGNLLVLTEKQSAISDLSGNIDKVQICSLNESGVCVRNMTALVTKCRDTLLYALPSFKLVDGDSLNHFGCFDRVYLNVTCEDDNIIKLKPKENGYDSVLTFAIDQYGWTEAFVNGKQFVMPSLENVNFVINKCSFQRYNWHYFLQDPLPTDIGEEPIRLAACKVEIFGNSYRINYDGNGDCHNFIYVRSCYGRLLFDLSVTFNRQEICLIQHSNVKVIPEIHHEENVVVEGGNEVTMYTPFLNYRCTFDMEGNVDYKANWYINGTFRKQTGPSSTLDGLVFRENYLDQLRDGYEVRCGILNASDNQAIESLSDSYFAGWKILNKDVSLSKSGYAIVTIEQTIPLGCRYRTGDFGAKCLDTISFENLLDKKDNCGGIKVTSIDSPSKSSIEIKSLKKGETWENKKYTVKLSTIDNDYDDNSTFNLQLKLAYNSNANIGMPVTSKVVGHVKVDILNIKRHWNKRCYSHVDPHMKTVDGISYEAQREGDYMLFLNKKYQTEIQTSARYCNPKYKGSPVCACGIAVAVGADLFIINRCHDQPFMFDFICGDGGIIDIERVHDYRYLVKTPIGTIVEIDLFPWNTVMNIDVYMSAKDFENVAGLCGNFDGNRNNDLEHRDGTFSNDYNWSYKFADSWRLADEENLFKNQHRKLDSWNESNTGNTNNSCSRANISITRNKCKIKRRQRRSSPKRELNKPNHSFQSLKKRSERILTEKEAFKLCNDSIYLTPAVKDFSDKLAEENPDVVVEQCVHDIMQGKDTFWVDAHIAALNYATDVMLRLRPGFVAVNIDKVNQFRTETCLNNCSGNGICSTTGLCECSGNFRGPDCSIDVTIPPVIYEFEGDGVCTVADDDDCTCYQIRTDKILDGFVCKISEFKVYLDGTHKKKRTSIQLGNYEDIFTGECCAPSEFDKDSFDLKEHSGELSILMYEFSVSNDGLNYGQKHSVYILDTKCLKLIQIHDKFTFRPKDNHCFIDGLCVDKNISVSDNSTCHLCDPASNPYSWTTDKCEEDSGKKLGTSTIAGIVIGSLILITITVVITILICKRYKNVITNTYKRYNKHM